MRAAPALAAALLALAACKVDVEGAPCGAPGETADCPAGQACGNDGRCSERAATCARCTPGDSRCDAADGAAIARRCTGADPVCGSWESEDCGAAGLVCGAGRGDGAVGCVCPSFGGPVFAADPVAGSAAAEPPFATGAEAPAACRFRRLGDAIAAAGALASAATVQAYATAPAQAEVVFGDVATGEDPIAIPANVTVAGAAGAETSLRFERATAAPLVALRGALRGIEIDAVAATGAGVAASCGAAGKPSMTGVVVEGGGALAAGVDVSGSCGADLSGVTVAAVAGPALRVHAEPSAPVTVEGGALRDSAAGARVTGGAVTFGDDGDPARGVEIAGNAGEGVVVAAGAAADVRLYGARVHGNGGTGIVVDLASAGSAVTVRGCDVYENGRAAPRSYGPDGATRQAGGVLVAQAPMPLTLLANRIWANARDQLAFESSAAWSIAPAACGSASNVFACLDPDGSPFAVAIAGGGSVDARFTVWPGIPLTTFASDGVTGSYCEKDKAGVPSTPACPSP